MTTFLLIRHAMHELGPSRLAGRLPGVRLTDKGRAQAERLADRLHTVALTALYSSPQQRTRETAAPIAERCGVGVEIVDALDEVDFGEWSGKAFEDLDNDPRWAPWNADRNTAVTPTGETIADLRDRIVGHIEHCCASNPGGCIALVTHAEVIRTAVLHYLGMSFDAWTRLEIEPASISRLVFTDSGPVLAGLNEKVVA